MLPEPETKQAESGRRLLGSREDGAYDDTSLAATCRKCPTMRGCPCTCTPPDRRKVGDGIPLSDPIVKMARLAPYGGFRAST